MVLDINVAISRECPPDALRISANAYVVAMPLARVRRTVRAGGELWNRSDGSARERRLLRILGHALRTCGHSHSAHAAVHPFWCGRARTQRAIDPRPRRPTNDRERVQGPLFLWRRP